MTRLETLIELTSKFSMRAFRACPPFATRQTAPCRATRDKSSDSRQQYLSQQYPPPLLILATVRPRMQAAGLQRLHEGVVSAHPSPKPLLSLLVGPSMFLHGLLGASC